MPRKSKRISIIIMDRETYLDDARIANIATVCVDGVNDLLNEYFGDSGVLSSDEDSNNSGDESDIDIQVIENTHPTGPEDEVEAIMRTVDFCGDTDTETLKIRDFCCGCKEASQDRCHKAMPIDKILQYRMNMSENSEDEKDCIIIGLIAGSIVSNSHMTQRSKKVNNERKKGRSEYRIDGYPICVKSFEFILR